MAGSRHSSTETFSLFKVVCTSVWLGRFEVSTAEVGRGLELSRQVLSEGAVGSWLPRQQPRQKAGTRGWAHAGLDTGQSHERVRQHGQLPRSGMCGAAAVGKPNFSVQNRRKFIFPPIIRTGYKFRMSAPKSEIFSVQVSSVAQSCPTLCDPTNRSTPGLPVHHQLLEFTQTHVH